MNDALTPLILDAREVRGAIVSIDTGVEAMLDARPYSADVRRLVGEAAAGAPLLASQLKFRGRINLQFQRAPGGDAGESAPLSLLVTQVDHRLTVRAMAKARADAAGSFGELAAGGYLALMLDPVDGAHRYQALVPVFGDHLAQALEGYYAQSEQLPTRLLLAAAPNRLAGLLLQRMPTADPVRAQADWEHVVAILDTLSPVELVETSPETLLRRVFHAETVRLFPPRPVRLACTCSRGSISRLLLALGDAELEPELKAHRRVRVTCEFCGRIYDYAELEVRELFAAARAPGAAAVRH